MFKKNKCFLEIVVNIDSYGGYNFDWVMKGLRLRMGIDYS